VARCDGFSTGSVIKNFFSAPKASCASEVHWNLSTFVTEPPKSLGPPTVVLVQQTLDNPVDVPESLDKFGIFSYLSRNVSPVLQTLQNIGDIEMRK
jgi:hypothetical protein